MSYTEILSINGKALCDSTARKSIEEFESEGYMRVSDGYIQFSADNVTWANVIAVSELKGETGETGARGATGADGEDGLTPFVGENGNWWIGEEDTGVSAGGTGSSGGGTPKTQKLLDVTFEEATASISVTLEHNFHKLFLLWKGTGEIARMVDTDGNGLASDLIVVLDADSATWNDRVLGRISSSTGTWQMDSLTMEWSEDLSTYYGSINVSVGAAGTNKYVMSNGGGGNSFLGTIGTSDSLAPQSGRTIYVLTKSGMFTATTRIVLVGEYYE